MMIIMKANATPQQVENVILQVKSAGLNVHLSQGVEATIIGAIGDERKMDAEAFEGMECVEKVLRILKPYKIVSRDFQKEDTVITVRGQEIGGGTVALVLVDDFAGAVSERLRRLRQSPGPGYDSLLALPGGVELLRVKR